jgi:hypothetical protein
LQDAGFTRRCACTRTMARLNRPTLMRERGLFHGQSSSAGSAADGGRLSSSILSLTKSASCDINCRVQGIGESFNERRDYESEDPDHNCDCGGCMHVVQRLRPAEQLYRYNNS